MTTMFIPATQAEARKGVAPTVRVATTQNEHCPNPQRDPDLIDEAARRALTTAAENGYQSVAYDAVTEFMRLDSKGNVIYVYIWMFTAWDEADTV